jgi:hypothetical protein
MPQRITCPESGHLETIECLVAQDGELLVVLRCSRFDPAHAVDCAMVCIDRLNCKRRMEAAPKHDDQR